VQQRPEAGREDVDTLREPDGTAPLTMIRSGGACVEVCNVSSGLLRPQMEYCGGGKVVPGPWDGGPGG
jgi:hypothetical protein